MDKNILTEQIKFNDEDIETKFSYFYKYFKNKCLIELNKDILVRFNFINEDGFYNKEAFLLMDHNPFTMLNINIYDKNKKLIDKRDYSSLSIIEIYDLLFSIYKDKYEEVIIDRQYKEIKEKLPRIAFLIILVYSLIYKTWDSNKAFIINFYDDFVKIEFDINENSSFNNEHECDDGELICSPLSSITNLFIQLRHISTIWSDKSIINEIYKGYKYKPMFNISKTKAIIDIPAFNYYPSWSYDENKIIDCLLKKDGLGLTCKEIGLEIHYSYRKVTRIIKKLVETGYIKKGEGLVATKYYL